MNVWPKTLYSIAAGYALALPAQAVGPTGYLNDTGQTQCRSTDGLTLEACSQANAGNSGSRPGQDGRFGRDPAAGSGSSGLTKPAGSGGSGGFAFTPLDASGNAIALTGSPPVPSATPRCILDNVTNLIWEVKTTSGLQDQANTYGWGSNPTGTCSGGSGCSSDAYITDVNALNLCGETANDWRLPTRRELLSIVDSGRTPAPTIDISYFPNTASNYYWSSDVYAGDFSGNTAWSVRFSSGATVSGNDKTVASPVRLVRNGP